jgi:DNA polymerase epsilon subunit 2
VLEEVARSWKNRNGGVIVEGTSKELQEILKALEGNMSGGRITGSARGLPRGDSMLDIKDNEALNTRLGLRPAELTTDDANKSFGMSGLGVEEEPEEENTKDPRAWLKIINAYEQPRLIYNVSKKHFERFVHRYTEIVLVANSSSETLRRLHYYQQHHTKPQSSATAIMSSTSVSSETNPSRPRPSPPPASALFSVLYPINSPSNSRQSPTCWVVMVAVTCC